MSGLEILGALAAGVQLAGLCLDIMNRLHACSSDKRLSEFVQMECVGMINEIDECVLKLSANHRCAALEMQKYLSEICERIERRKQRKWLLRWSEKLRFNGMEDKDAMILVLQQYQTRATISGAVTIEEIKNRVDEIPNSMRGLLDSVVVELVNAYPKSF
jgi:hypothetical protein